MQKVSVIVPVYNVEDYIGTCVDSLLSQDYADVDIILVDDGSTDGSGIICDAYAQNNAKVTALHKRNGGLSSARNYGMHYATGSYALFVDSDDALVSTALSTCMRAIKNSVMKNDCVVFTYSLVDEVGNSMGADSEAETFPNNLCVSGKQALVYLLQDRIQNFVWRIIFPVEMWRNSTILFPQYRLFEDVLTTYLFFVHSNTVIFINRRLYKYRQRSGSILHNVTAPTAEAYRDAFIDRSESIEKLFPELRDLCEAQKYKAFYRVAVFTLASSERPIVAIRDKAINYLKETRVTTSTLKIFNVKQRITLILLKHMPADCLNTAVSLAKKIQRNIRIRRGK
jgi:glycosyltransferase involved in cell wall biosynthesis